MTKLANFLREHKLAVILAVAVSIIVAFPQVYFRIDHKDDGVYQGIELLPDSPWSARVREVQDGHPNFGAIYYKDGKGDPYLFQPLGSAVVAYMGKTFGLGINNTILLSRLVLPFIAFLLVYFFVFLFSQSKLVALSSASMLLLADSILSYSGISQILGGASPDSFLRLARPVNPAMIYILIFAFLISFWLFYRSRNLPAQAGWRWGLASAILLGLNFYNYFYSWTYLYAFGAFLVLFFLLRKNWREAARISSVFLGALIFAIPYGINLYRATLHPVYEEASLRFGVITSHAPLFVGFVVLGALAIFLFGFPREDRQKYLFGLALLLAPFITLNQQLLTGKILQPAHYHWFFHKPMAVIFVFIIIFYLTRYKKAVATFIILASFFVGIFVQAQSYYHDKRDGGTIAIERQKYGPVMNWLNENAQKESVVLSNDETSHLVVIYTPLNVFYHRAAIYSLSATRQRLLDVLFTFYRLRGIGVQDVRATFFAERGYISANVYGIHYRELLGSYEAIPDGKIEEIVRDYQATLATPATQWLKQIFEKYEVEYVVWDKKGDPDWVLGSYNFLQEAVAFGDMAIYKVR